MALTLIPGVGAFLFLLIWVLILSYPILYLFHSFWFFIDSCLGFVGRSYTWFNGGCYSPYLLIFHLYDTFLELNFGSSDHY